jgi:hypothetical protein
MHPPGQNLHFHGVLESSIANNLHFYEVLEGGSCVFGGVPNRKKPAFLRGPGGVAEGRFPSLRGPNNPNRHFPRVFHGVLCAPPRPKPALSWGFGVINCKQPALLRGFGGGGSPKPAFLRGFGVPNRKKPPFLGGPRGVRGQVSQSERPRVSGGRFPWPNPTKPAFS